MLRNFNPRTPYGMRRAVRSAIQQTSIFQSTHPLRDATIPGLADNLSSVISIHAPLTGCDSAMPGFLAYDHNFNPRTPYGMRPDALQPIITRRVFQSTHPLRDATFTSDPIPYSAAFQSTHPLRDATAGNLYFSGFLFITYYFHYLNKYHCFQICEEP